MSLIIKKMQIKIMMRYYYIPVIRGEIWITDDTKWWREFVPIGTLIHFWE